MDDSNETISDSERLRLGRLVFDGAEPEVLAARLGLITEDVEAAWQYCRELLSQHFAAANGHDFRLLAVDELRSHTIECLRLLLDWRELVLMHERTRHFAVDNNVADETDGA